MTPRQRLRSVVKTDLTDDDVSYFDKKIKEFLPFFKDLSENRQIVMIEMCQILGIHGLANFIPFILSLEAQDYERAAQEMLNSKWANQCEASKTLSKIMRTDEL